MNVKCLDYVGDQEKNKMVIPHFFKTYLSKLKRGISSGIDVLLGRRVSLIHLVEAKERHKTLNSIIEFHENRVCEDNLQDDSDKTRAILSCRIQLDEAKELLTRDQKDLNDVWRILTRVRNLIMEHILDKYGLIQQLDFCREEAFRLDVAQDPVISDMLQKLAEATDEDNVHTDRIKRHVRALNERFNTIRTARIYDQFVKMRIYKTALLVLIFLSAMLIVLTEQVLTLEQDQKSIFPGYDYQWSSNFFESLANIIPYHIGYMVRLCQTNVLAFVFASGLIGGFFSVVLRVRTHQRRAGEDAYFRMYVLSRPLVGALGAMVVFILFNGGFVSDDLVGELGKLPDPKVFGFAFLSGFSERVVFPNFR